MEAALSMEDVCSFLDQQADENSLQPQPSLGAAAASLAATGSSEDGDGGEASNAPSGMSHLCGWPGCGKGFASRWSLERHMKNHQPLESGEGEQQPDSFVERRLRERLKSVQQALDKAREKLQQQARQQELADAELHEARTQLQQQTTEIQMLSRRLSSTADGGFSLRNTMDHHGAPGLPPDLSSLAPSTF
jgi:hypothetical protein